MGDVRVAIAGARLDLQAGLLWHHLDRDVPRETSRWKPGSVQRKKVAELATQRLSGDLQAVWAAMSSVEAAQKRRNEVIHQDWVLRGREAMRSVTEIAAVADEDRGDYLEDWQRQATESATGSGCQLARLTWCQPKPWRSCGPSNGSWRR